MRGVVQLHGDGADGAQVLGHVLAGLSIAAGGAADEPAVHVLQRHGQAVHFRLHDILRLRRGLPDAGVKGGQFLRGEHVLQGLQGHLVGHRLKGFQRLAAHPLGGGIGGDILRVFRL